MILDQARRVTVRGEALPRLRAHIAQAPVGKAEGCEGHSASTEHSVPF